MSSKEAADDVLAKLKELMGQIAEHIEPIISRQKEEIFEGMDNTDVAKVLGALSFSLEAFVFLYLSIQGTLSSDHPVHQDMKRCLSYLKKIRDSDSLPNKARVNTEAAQRFIRNALWSRDSTDDNKG